MKLYKGKYVISVYNDRNDDELVGMFECVEDFAKFFNQKIDTAYGNLSKYFFKKHNYMKHCGNVYSVHFISI